MYGGEICDIRNNEVSSLRIDESEDIKSLSGGVGEGLRGRGNQGCRMNHESGGREGRDEVINVFEVKNGRQVGGRGETGARESASRAGSISRAMRGGNSGRSGGKRGASRVQHGGCRSFAK